MLRRFVIAAGSFAVALSLAGTLDAQTGVLSGVIFDETNRAGLSGVQVAIKGTDLVGVTNKDGKFTIAGVPAGSRQLEAWRVGYRNFKLSVLKIAPDDTAHVYLALSAAVAEPEVAPKAAVSPEEAAALERLEARLRRIEPTRAVGDTVLQGKVAGVTMRQDGGPGGERVIQLRNPVSYRSDAAPVYIVDGVIMVGGMQPGSIDASRIESIEVVQGQQAVTLFGTNVGANGVIVIKTKKQ
jgi:hypothetical protein